MSEFTQALSTTFAAPAEPDGGAKRRAEERRVRRRGAAAAAAATNAATAAATATATAAQPRYAAFPSNQHKRRHIAWWN